MSDDVFLKFEYDERDIWNGVRLRLAGRLRGAWLILLGSASASAVMAMLAPAWGRIAAGGVATLTVAALALVALRVAPPTMFRAPPLEKRAKTTRGAPEPEGFRDATMSIDASDDGISVTVGARLATIRWEDCERLQADRRCYVLHFGSGGFVVVPRRRFRNERRDGAFRELVETCMEGARSADLEGPEEEADGRAG